MQKCEYCDHTLLDGEEISFIATGTYKQYGPRPNTFGIREDFKLEAVYHPECLYYDMNEGEYDQ